MNEPDYIDIDDPNPSPSQPAFGQLEERDRLLTVPDLAQELLPSPCLSISEFLNFTSYCPTPRQSIIPHRVYFSHEACDPNPHAIVNALRSRSTFPPHSILGSLETQFDQALTNGSCLVIDSYYDKFPLPLWTLTFWYQLLKVDTRRTEWRAVEQYIAASKHRDMDVEFALREVVDRLFSCMHQVKWSEPVLGFPVLGWRPELATPATQNLAAEGFRDSSTPIFMQFFRNGMLNSDAINMMLEYLSLRVARDESLARKVIIANLGFTNRLLLEYSGTDYDGHPPTRSLARYGLLFTRLRRERLYFVANSCRDHWVAVEVNFAQRTIAYGDSLAGVRIKDQSILSALTAWLNEVVEPSSPGFTIGNNLPCERQEDGWSCGIASCTTISNSIGLDASWSNNLARYMRLTWAERVLQIHIQAKSVSGTLPFSTPAVDLVATSTQSDAGKGRMSLNLIMNDSLAGSLEDIQENCDPSCKLEGSPPVADSGADSDSSNVCVVAEGLKDRLYMSNPQASKINDIGGKTLGSSPLVLQDGTKLEKKANTLKPRTTPVNVLRIDDEGVLHFSDSDQETEANPPKRVASPTRVPGKHHRSISEDLAVPAALTLAKRRVLSSVYEERNSGPTGLSRAIRVDKAAKEAAARGKLVITERQRERLLGHAKRLDPQAELDPNDPAGMRILHSTCGEWINLDYPKRTSKFTRHVPGCDLNHGLRKNGKFTKAAASDLRIDEMFKKQAARSDASLGSHATSPERSPTPPKLVPCLGLRLEHDERLDNLFQRGPLGGRESLKSISESLYNKKFADLTPAEKERVRLAQSATASWLIFDDPRPHIQHADCLKECDPDETDIQSGPTDLCQKCADLMLKREFTKAFKRDLPTTEMAKYVPNNHRGKHRAMVYARYVGLEKIVEESDSKRSPLMNLVAKVLSGELKNSNMFMGLLEVMAAKDDRESRGKGLQGFQRPPAFTAFCHAVLISSPRAYRLLGQHFPVPTERNLRSHRSKAPGFPIGVSDLNVQRAVEYLSKIGYKGPVSISCDDTQLLSKFTPYFNGPERKWCLLGGVNAPIEIDDELDGIEERISEAIGKATLATKCRLWCLQVPIPGTPVFILAAMAINSTLKAEELLISHNTLINGLLDAGVCVVSYSCDGSVTERKVASQFLQTAKTSTTLEIPHPRPGFPPIVVTLYRFGPQSIPIVTAQDLKHAIKSARNGAYSGTTTFTIGNCTVHYLQILMLSVDPRSPLYQRDVTKVDRQDDRAATRLFSSAFLQHVCQVANEQASGITFKPAPLSIVSSDLPAPSTVLKHSLVGLMAWLFVFGDAFNAFQNRSLDIDTRLVMVLRLFFFLELWKSSLHTLGYSEAQHFITRDLYYILNNLVYSFLGLVYVYRDELDYPHYPFCPWLHSTEGCEHTFGEARKVKPDFTFADFITMVPKLDVLSATAVATGDDTSDAKARAAGYAHTLYARLGVNVDAISEFPVDSLIHRAAKIAHDEAEIIFSRCGLAATSSLCRPPASNVQPICKAGLDGQDFIAPSIDEWFRSQESELESSEDASTSCDMACDFAEVPRRLTHEIECMLEEGRGQWGTTASTDDQLAAFASAAMALELEERHKIEALPDQDQEKNWSRINWHLHHAIQPLPLRPLVIANEVNYESFLGTNGAHTGDYSSLVALRSAHETTFAKKSVRVGVLNPEKSTTGVMDDDETDFKSNISTDSARLMLMKKISATLKTVGDEAGSIAGANRRTRHEGKFELVRTGNSANAAAASKARGSKALTTREAAFSQAKMKCSAILGKGGVTALAPVQTGSYAFVLVGDKVWFAEVLTLYSKGAGKGGKHSWVNKQTNLASVSYLGVQLWEHSLERDFRSTPRDTAQHYAKQYAHIPSQRVLYVASPPREKPEKHTDGLIRLNSSLSGIWEMINAELPRVCDVVAALLKRPKKGGDNEEDDD